MGRNFLLTGGTGLIGRHLSRRLIENGHRVSVLTRQKTLRHRVEGVKYYEWDWKKDLLDNRALENIEVVIHLAGAPIARHWTPAYQTELKESRILSLRLLRNRLLENGIRLQHFLGASAIGYYGCTTDNRWRHEDDPPGDDFLARLVVEWEAESKLMKPLAANVSVIRTGIVLARDGGAFPRMVRPVRWGLSMPLGNGQQYLDWIHIDDLVRIYLFLFKNGLEGVYNAVAPDVVRQREFIRETAKMLKRPCCLPGLPAAIVKRIWGKQACLLLEGVPVSSQRIRSEGFMFDYHVLPKALHDLL